MKRFLLFLFVAVGTPAFAQSVQFSLEAGLHRYRNYGEGQAGRYELNVKTPVTTGWGAIGYTVGAHAKLLTNSPFFAQIGLRHSGQEVGVQYVDTQPQLPYGDDEFIVSYAGNYLYRLDAPVVAGLGFNLGRDVRLEAFGGVTPSLNAYKHTGNYRGRFDWTALVIDESLNRFSWGHLVGATVWVRRWGVTVAREGSLTPLNRNVNYRGQEYPFTTGFRAARVSVSYRFGNID